MAQSETTKESEVMEAWVNDNGIRLNGLAQFQATGRKGMLDAILDKLNALNG